jgi:GTP cyclohydrolase I
VSDVRYPITVLDRGQERQRTVARLTMSVSLPHHFKGTHMSHFIEVLNRHRGGMTMRTLPGMLQELRRRLQAESARVEVVFPYFLEHIAPASGARSWSTSVPF